VNQLGSAAADTLTGTAGNDGLFGLEGNDTLMGGAGSDGLSGGAGADWLDGGAGADRLGGGAGDDTFIVDNALDYVAEAAGQGRDTVRASVSYALGQNLTGLYKQLYDNVEDLVLTGSADIDATGNALDNTLTGNDGANVLEGKLGNDTLIGGAGADTYRFNRGDGQDLIVDSQSFSRNVDVLSFGAGINANQLWLRKVVPSSAQDAWDLEIQLMGTGDKVTIAGWQRAVPWWDVQSDRKANHIEQIRSADGRTLLDTKVAQLVDAMASMAPPTGATSWSQLTASQQAQLNALGAWG
jgi:Ca2+-binding RTX toxin-like protein